MCACECVISGCILVCICQTSKQVPLPASFGSKQSYKYFADWDLANRLTQLRSKPEHWTLYFGFCYFMPVCFK